MSVWISCRARWNRTLNATTDAPTGREQLTAPQNGPQLSLPLPRTSGHSMERARVKDGSSGPRSTEDVATPPTQTDPSLDPGDQARPSSLSTTDFQYADESRFSGWQSLHPPRSKPLFRGFERPTFSRIAILAVLCPTAYPAFYLLTFVANDRSLFVVRLLVSTCCSVVGFALGYTLLKIGAQHLEAVGEFSPAGHRDLLTLSKQPGQP